MRDERKIKWIALVVVGLLVTAFAVAAPRVNPRKGKVFYKKYCRVCHDGSTEAKEMSPMTKTMEQWGRDFKEGGKVEGHLPVAQEKTEGSSRPIGAFLVPEMRLKEAEDLAQMGAVTSCIDISDGISTDAGHIASSSGVGILVQEDLLPFPPEMRGIANKMKLDPTNLALNGGDDFELLFTSPPEFTEQIRESEIGLIIGEVVNEPGVHLKDVKGKVERLNSSGYQHFTGRGR